MSNLTSGKKLSQRNRVNAELFTNQATHQLVQSFLCCRKNECGTRPIEFETCRLGRNPDLTRRTLRADDDLAGIWVFNFDRQHVVLKENLDIVLFRDDAERAIQFVERSIAVRSKLRFG